MAKFSKQTVKDLLLEAGVATAERLEEIDQIHDETGQPYDQILIDRKVIDEKALYQLYSKSIGFPFLDLEGKQIPRDILLKVPERIASKYRAVLVGLEAGQYILAMADPEDYQASEFIEKQIGTAVKVYSATPSDIAFALDQYKESLGQEITKTIKGTEFAKEEGVEEEVSEEDVDLSQVAEAPIAKAVNIIYGYAVKNRATDIHIEPREGFVQIRYRIDGILREAMTLPRTLLAPVVSRIKILSNLKIDEHRLPQDGRIKIRVAGKVFGVRVSILPTIYGEKIVMRLLEESSQAYKLEELGFQGPALEIMSNAIKRPHGITFVTGPTGSGKTTTLYSVASYLNTPSVNISTIEDPVEYRIPGTNQVQVNVKAGMTFAVGLRALLRQDPNVIMIGEIRDKETLEIAIHAALTGHIVLTTLHTNNAAGTFPRLLDMGAEPFLVASTINAAFAQRLVRKLCPHCKKPVEYSGAELDEIKKNFNLDDAFRYMEARERGEFKGYFVEEIGATREAPKVKAKKVETKKKAGERKVRDINGDFEHSMTKIRLWAHKGCNKCEGSGYLGRLGIYEAIQATESIQSLIIRHASSDEVQNAAIKEQNMMTMQADGLVKSLDGITSIEEVLRVTRE